MDAIDSIAQQVGSYIRGSYINFGAYRDAGVTEAEGSVSAFENQLQQKFTWLHNQNDKAFSAENLQKMARFMDNCGGFSALEKAVGSWQPQSATLRDDLESISVGQDLLVSHVLQVLLGAGELFQAGQLTEECSSPQN